MRRRFAFLAVLAVAAVGALAGAQGTQAQYTACCGNLRFLYSNYDSFMNYDFYSTSAVATNVDWPVTILFYNHADITKIRNAMANRGYGGGGLTIYDVLSDDQGGSLVWANDQGRKQGSSSTAYYHYRLYGNPAIGHNWSPGWGNYVWATTHQDYQECCGGWHGESEQAETHISADAGLAFGVSPAYDNANFYNYEPYRVQYGHQGEHRWRNSGRATYIRVP
jgi:hypothetical protein